MSSDDQLRQALAWETGTQAPEDKNVFEWLWEAIQGDFNENRSVGQIAFDSAVSMIPLVDQVCDLRDLIANSKAIATSDENEDNTWKWVALAFTLVGLIPTLGSVVKGALKILFLKARQFGGDHLSDMCEHGLSLLITWLRKPELQQYLRKLKVDEVFLWLADQLKVVRAMLSLPVLLRAFDRAIAVLKDLLGKVAMLPWVGSKARQTLEMVQKVRQQADKYLGAPVFGKLDRIIEAFIHRLELEGMARRSGILDTRNVHFRGAMPEARAVTLMRETEPPPAWLSKGKEGKWPEQELTAGRDDVKDMRAQDPGYPDLTDQNIRSFHTMKAVEIKGPAKLFRVTSPSNGAMGDCWVPEDVWNAILKAPDPKTAWRKYSAVWPDWNPNGQFVVLEIPAGEGLKVWRGPAASQKKKDLSGKHLEGGWDQVVIKVEPAQYDTTRYFMRGGGQGEKLHPPGLTREEWLKLSGSKRQAYTPVRERINHPNIKGPLDTGWGSTDFAPQLRDTKLGLPALPGQVTN
ncbi:hypothetical protein [Ideonella sp.]|jgi:hypothetical protein|uniref:hypothetical protein n=1 Tax=Ideonella sp. TaxID=1929293 RepID=UPI0037BEE40D